MIASDGEFDFIARYLRPLAAGHPAALDLGDDAALLEPAPGTQLVIAKDALVEGVHFLAHDPAELIAKKLLRVNLSDLAAMGATPLGYLMALARPKALTPEWLARLVTGLADAQALYGLALLGGDTVGTPGPLTLSVTMLGEVPRGQALRRSGARVGDDLYVSGTLGDAALGLKVLQGRLSVSMTASDYLIERYRLPEPRIALGLALRGLAHAAIDVSDGLVADLGHIAERSGIGAELWAERLPLSAATARLRGALEAALTGGDDYELLFTAHPEQRPAVEAVARELDLPISLIGRIDASQTVRVLDSHGQTLPIASAGWQHF